MKYILEDEAVDLVPGDGMYFVVTDIEGLGTIAIEDDTTAAWPSSPLPQVFAFPITITASGVVNVTVIQAGNTPSAGDALDSNGSTGHYPGSWGSGVGSK
jgi:hypothetical protein